MLRFRSELGVTGIFVKRSPMKWSAEERLCLKKLKLSPGDISPEALGGIVAHFKRGGTIYEAERKGIRLGSGSPIKKSHAYLSKVRTLTQAGHLDWILVKGPELDALKLERLREHHRYLTDTAKGLFSDVLRWPDHAEPLHYSTQVMITDGKPTWHPRVDGLQDLEQHLRSTPELLDLLGNIGAKVAEWILGHVSVVTNIERRLREVAPIFDPYKEWRRRFTDSCAMHIYRQAMDWTRGEKDHTRTEIKAHPNELGELLWSHGAAAVSEKKDELENWEELFWELTEKTESEIQALDSLKEPLRKKIESFAGRIDVMIKRGLFDGTCDICLPLLS